MDIPSQATKCAESDTKSQEREAKIARWRNIIAFWLLGLCNNYGYVVMLSAAHDILEAKFSDHKHTETAVVNATIADPTSRQCNAVSTGAILLADILPSLTIKLLAPFLPFFVNVRMATCVGLSILSFLAVSFGQVQWVTIMGVVLTSLSSGFGEATIISLGHKYGRDGIAAWSSGTGGAGIVGAFSYAALRVVMSTEQALLVMLVVPVAQAAAFWLVMIEPHESTLVAKYALESQEEIIKAPNKTLREKFALVPTVIKYIVPLGLVYLFEYFINQGLYELIQFDNIWLTHEDQYRWLQADYQIGVFISRSSAGFVTFKRIWLMALFQFINVILFLTESIFYYIPNIWIVFILVLWEGLLGGGAYVNTFYKMTDEVPSNDLKVSLGIVSMSDSLGIALSGWISIVAHTAICKLPKSVR
ncbi:battenin [Venturia canescens]|uniref:battenin n=1 Tax=Venturia canescens TaxID=32260 RepID=UPI001C9BD82F|nr:battenin [Venturia canescens]